MASKPSAPSTSNSPTQQDDAFSIQRGDYKSSSITSKLLFTLGRAITGPLQYYIITRHPLQALFPSLPAVPLGTNPALALTLPSSLASTFGLNPRQTFARLPLLCATMPTLLTAKQLIWYHVLMRERMTVGFAFFGVFIDLIYESISSLIFTTAGANPLWSERLFYIGLTVFASSVTVELVAELQRYVFKRDPANKGKLCTHGFWALARHVNYTANMVHGWAYGLACGGPLYSLATAVMYVANLGWNAAPSKERYMQEKYGGQWEQYVGETRSKFFPGIW